MTAKYALKVFFDKAEQVRAAQKAYYAHKGDLRTDDIKSALLKDSKSKEADLDNLLAQLPKAFPGILTDAGDQPAFPGGAMTVPEINAIRLAGWKDRLDERHSTPQVLIAVGIGPVQGQLMVLCTEDKTNEQVITFIAGALQQLKAH